MFSQWNQLTNCTPFYSSRLMNTFNEDTLVFPKRTNAKKRNHMKNMLWKIAWFVICFVCNQCPLLFYLMKIHSDKYCCLLERLTLNQQQTFFFIYRSHSLLFIYKLHIQIPCVLTARQQNSFHSRKKKISKHGVLIIVWLFHINCCFFYFLFLLVHNP